MAFRRDKSSVRGKKVSTGASPNARSLKAARQGIQTSREFKEFMSRMMSDLVEGRIAPQTANAVCNAGSKLLRVVELEYRYGRPSMGTLHSLPIVKGHPADA